MKMIFVTLAEFLENGGTLNQHRSLYDASSTDYYIGDFYGFNSMNMPLVGFKRIPMSIHDVGVHIECQPIYN